MSMKNDRVYLMKNTNMLAVYSVLTCLVGMCMFAVQFFSRPIWVTSELVNDNTEAFYRMSKLYYD